MGVEVFGKQYTLFFEGNRSLLERPYLLGVIGTRRAEESDLDWTDQFVKSFRGQDVVIVSGLARGIDTAAHRAALKYGLPTIAFLGTSLDKFYPPENEILQREIGKKGLVVSIVPTGTRTFDPGMFKERNKVLAHFVHQAVVSQASIPSGTLSTINALKRLCKPVYRAPACKLKDLPEWNESLRMSPTCVTMTDEWMTL